MHLALYLLRCIALVAALPFTLAAPDSNLCGALNPDCNKLGGVASEYKQCSDIGISLLKKGGNAADAMVGSVFCVGVLGMYHSGIGGGGFMLVRAANGSYEFIDFRETAPAAGFENMYKNNYNGSIFGGLASGVPGELRGLEHLHTNYGTLPWATVMRPAIKLAREGFEVSEDLISYIHEALDASLDPSYNFLVKDPTWAIDFAPNGTLVKVGDMMTRKRYADTLETIAEFGPDAFYTGAIANATITALQGSNGTMTLDDLKNYKVAIRKPAQITYRDYRITASSAPSSGVVAMSVMKILEGFSNIGRADRINISTHRLDEAMRWGYGERAKLGDPSFVSGMQAYEDGMISAATARAIRGKITADTHPIKYYDPAGIESLPTPGTSAVMAADASGLAVSLTTTVNLLFGSQLMVPETGVIMNDEMNDFSIPGSSNAFGYIPSPANFIRPGKRPLSSISPSIVEHRANASLYFVVGAAGGSRITTATIQNLWHVLDQGMDAYQALAQPRLHDQLVPNEVTFEYAYDNATVAFLKGRGANVAWVAPGESSAQAVRLLPNGTFEAAGEPRQSSAAGVVA